ncbi:uncharacterized protein LOC122378840 isoform X1 [Amphibalanus amphitrite]|uniref:uncharacterized protein LOC122378840 isoform X1 n=1 Tax=Amphibalanus amphitrite TaxID=1232801 RepID=UPI001C92772D|nr:uncharacterized protein LOC122378840 isoform X1 [Amphibalanus amphitrite]
MPVGRVEPFNVEEENWEEYVERMEEYFVANDITDEAKKRSTLLCNIGSKAYGIVRSLLSPVKPASSTYQLIVEKLTTHYHPKPSVTVARFRFFSCYRLPGESIQTYIARLRQFAGDCQFGTFLEEMIRDRLVCGVKSDLIQSRLLSEPELSLKKATEMAVAMETAGRNLQELSGAEAADPPRQEVQQIRSQQRSRPTAAGPATQQRAPRGPAQQAGMTHHTTAGDLPEPGETLHLVEMMDASPVTAAVVRLATERDATLSRVLQYTRDGWPEDKSGESPELSAYRTKQGELSIQNGCLLWGARVVIPVKLRERVLQMLHDGHMGESHTKGFARMYVWWPNLDFDITQMVKACVTCQQYRHQAPVTPLSPWSLPSRPYERVHIDYCGPVEGKMLLIVVDAYTKWIDVHVTTRATTEVTMEELRKTFAYWGIPKFLVSDNAQCFVAPAFQSFCTQNGITHLRTAPLSPKSNGLAERAVQTVKQGLRKQGNGTLHTKLARVLFTYRSSPHSTTGVTPAELMTGRRMRTRLDCMLPSLQDRVVSSQWKMKERYDRQAQRRTILPGMSVLVSQVSGLAGVGRTTRWLPGHCINISGLKLTVRLDDGRVLQRHLDQVVPRAVAGNQAVRQPTDWTAAPRPPQTPLTSLPTTPTSQATPSPPTPSPPTPTPLPPPPAECPERERPSSPSPVGRPARGLEGRGELNSRLKCDVQLSRGESVECREPVSAPQVPRYNLRPRK